MEARDIKDSGNLLTLVLKCCIVLVSPYTKAVNKPIFHSPKLHRAKQLLSQMVKTVPTIYDVASAAGVSIATVSRVINAPQKVNPATLSKVLYTIEALGFEPKAEARARAMKVTRRVGVITPFFTEPSFVQRLRGVSDVLTKRGYELVIYTVDSLSRLNHYLETLPFTGDLVGLVVLSMQVDVARAKRLLEKGLETVLVENTYPFLSSVEIDDFAGGEMVADFLASRGHRELAFIGDEKVPEQSVHPIPNRLKGFRFGLEKRGISLVDEWICLAPFHIEGARQRALELLNTPKRPTAIFASTDLQAMGVMQAARDHGLRVPDDLAVVGFDDLDIAEYIGLTTVRQHLDESGRIAAELLLSRISDPSRPVHHTKLPLQIIERVTA